MSENENPFKIDLDTNDDGKVSESELDAGLNQLAEVETGITDGSLIENDAVVTETDPEVITESDVGDMADLFPTDATMPEVSSDPITDTAPTEPSDLSEEDVMKALGCPTKESLTKAIRPSNNLNDLGHRQHWSIECQKFADKNDLHFLGFSIKDDEPMFKEKI